jgi:hypothetical protein
MSETRFNGVAKGFGQQRVDNNVRAFEFIKLVLIVLFKVSRVRVLGAAVVLLNHGTNIEAPNLLKEV